MSLQPAYHEHFDRVITPVAIRDIDEDKADALIANADSAEISEDQPEAIHVPD